MNYHRPDKLYPQALLSVYITLRNDSEYKGGATMERLKAAYENIVGRIPCDRTIERMISKIDETVGIDRPVVHREIRYSIIKYRLREDGYVLQRSSGF